MYLAIKSIISQLPIYWEYISLGQSCDIKKICIKIDAIQKLDFAGIPTFQNYMFQIDIASFIRKWYGMVWQWVLDLKIHV
jgi:hypothetical protein